MSQGFQYDKRKSLEILNEVASRQFGQDQPSSIQIESNDQVSLARILSASGEVIISGFGATDSEAFDALYANTVTIYS